MLGAKKGVNRPVWNNLMEKAENPLGLEIAGETVKTVEIEVKELLAIGLHYLGQPEVAVVKDEQGKVQILPEGKSLVSRHNVEEGMKLRLKITERTYFEQKTEVFVIE